jgi:hypothetical protein
MVRNQQGKNMANYIPIDEIRDLINAHSDGEQKIHRSAIEETLKNEGVIIIYDSAPTFDDRGYVTNTSQEHPTFKKKEDFLEWLDNVLSLYWVPIRNESGAYVEGPFSKKEANDRRQIIIGGKGRAGGIFHSYNKDKAMERAYDFV